MPGRPFQKGHDPRRNTDKSKGGRPANPPEWKEMAETLRLAIVRILSMDKEGVRVLLSGNPTGAEMLAAKYVHEHPTEAVNRFLGKTPDVIKSELTGKDGAPLVPAKKVDLSDLSDEKLDKLIAAAATAARPKATPTAGG